MKYQQLKELVNNYQTKYPQGFIKSELEELITKLGIDSNQFNEAFGVNTVMVINNEIIHYHTDVLRALNICLNNVKYLDFD